MTIPKTRLLLSLVILMGLLVSNLALSQAITDKAATPETQPETIYRANDALVTLPEPDGAGRDAYFMTRIEGKEPATDSASAATAMATGHKTDAGNIAWASGDPVDGALTTIAEQLRADKGFAIGVASTVPFNHATPAAFVSHNVLRGNKAEIAHEIIFTATADVVIGGGYDNSYFPLDNPDYGLLTTGQTSYTHVITRITGQDANQALSTLAATVELSQGHKLFGLFGSPGGNFEYHDVADDPGNPSVTRGAVKDPTLKAVTEATLSILSQDPDGFFVMFEQGDIDWSNHANDFESMVGGIWDLDQAVQAAEAFVEGPGDDIDWNNTLMILTSDHSNSYLRLREWLGAGDLPLQIEAGAAGYGNAYVYPDDEITYQTSNHTNELVTLWARGQGADLFRDYAGQWYRGRQIVDNTNIYDVVQRATDEAGVKYVILFIGDGMNIEHEIAGSRYLYGENLGLSWHDWGLRQDGWASYCSTWDVDTYNKYATVQAVSPYDPQSFEPTIGYSPDKGGAAPFPLQPDNPQFSSYIPGALTYVAAEGYTTTVQVPASAVGVTTTLVLAPWEAGTPPSDLAFAGDAFDLDVYVGNALQKDYTFNAPITLTIVYSDTELADVDLYRWYDDAWTKVAYPPFWSESQAESCNWEAGASTLTCSLWRLSSLAPLGSTEIETVYRVYLPLATKGQ